MSHRRILSLWFPRLAAELALRQMRGLAEVPPLAVVADESGVQRLVSLTAAAEAVGLQRGQSLRDARAMCPDLLTRPTDRPGEAEFLAALRRWAGRFSPWVAEAPPESLMLDISGCAHLFGGEEPMAARILREAADLGLSLSAAIADTPGAAWALARYGAATPLPERSSGDVIRQEARATRARAVGRRPPQRAPVPPPPPHPGPPHPGPSNSGLPNPGLPHPRSSNSGLPNPGHRCSGPAHPSPPHPSPLACMPSQPGAGWPQGLPAGPAGAGPAPPGPSGSSPGFARGQVPERPGLVGSEPGRGSARPAAQGPLPLQIAPPGRSHAALAGLPVAALRLPGEAVAELGRLGLRQVGDLTGMPRAALARRFGREVLRRLDQALGAEPEPLSAARPVPCMAVRLTLPEPIGLESDMLAALDRMLPRLCDRLQRAGRGARRLRLQAFRADGGVVAAELGLARPLADPAPMRELLAMKLGQIEAGFGIDALRLEALLTEPVHPVQHSGHADAAAQALARHGGSSQARGDPAGGIHSAGRRDAILHADGAAPADPRRGDAAGAQRLDDLLGRLGTRVGMEAITRLHPGDSHIPEKAVQTLQAAWAKPAGAWPAPPAPRPLVLLSRPELVQAPEVPLPPVAFRWRRRDFDTAGAVGPERIAPEWWLDDPAWRSGVRDYWRVDTGTGLRLWLFFAHGGAVSGGWFCHGVFM